jgi:hypothetical protein
VLFNVKTPLIVPLLVVDMASVIPYPVSVVGVPVMLDHAGVIVTAVPVDVIRPFASTVYGVICV